MKVLCEIATEPDQRIGDTHDKDKNNCLHVAIARKFTDRKAITALIEKSDDDALKARDADGNTPLHLAVNDENFVDVEHQQFLVEKLTKKCRDALEVENNEVPINEDRWGEVKKGGVGKTKEKLAPFLFCLKCHKSYVASQKPPEETKSSHSNNPEEDEEVRKSTSKKQEKEEGQNSLGSDFNKHSRSKSISNPVPRLGSSQRGRPKGLSEDKVVLIYRNLESFLKKFILQNLPHDKALKMLYGPVSGISQTLSILITELTH